ncbi:unnamed protein product [Rhizoctonia solani]|uniref:DUF6535 domain-containing protein n=1 Tax=Rhizoctonia solani TaxID=456999 RepID=A0A8H3DQS6_9AGAM|nr:unnamed protein product [Rhizoctonia solani]
MDQVGTGIPDTVLNFSEIRYSKRGDEVWEFAPANPGPALKLRQPLPTNGPQPTTPSPFVKTSPIISVTGADLGSENPHTRLAADPLGQELRPQASIWKMYVEEATKQDTELVDVQNKNLDLMLLFAALFSAILTAFLIESTNMLRQDPVGESASLLLFIAQSQRRIELGTPAEVINPIESGKFSPTPIARFINGLWFTALVLSLSAALIAMLAKEWLASYLATSVRPTYERSLARQEQFDGLIAWHTLTIISFLPSLLHLSLLLFSLGLVVYLWALDTGIAVVVAIITGLTVVFYLATLVCGVAFDPCPFVTQLSKYIRTVLWFYIPEWNPQRTSISPDTLISHGTIAEEESRALSWLLRIPMILQWLTASMKPWQGI